MFFRSGLRLTTVVVALGVGLASGATSAAEQPDSPGNSAGAPGQQDEAGTADPGNSAAAPGQVKKEDPPAGEAAPAETETTSSSGGNGANQSGPYDPSGVGAPSGNGRSDQNNGNRPCAGCVGNADAKNPPGQLPGGSDPNNGYECDGNQGVGKTNPAHSGCGSKTTTTPPGGGPPGGGPPGGGPPGGGPPGGGPPGVQETPPPTVAAPQAETAPAPRQEVLGREQAGGEAPGGRDVSSPTRAPEAAPRDLPTGELPFTGRDLPIVALLGALALITGVGLARVLSPKRIEP